MGDDPDRRLLLEARRLICPTIFSLMHTTSVLLELLHFQYRRWWKVCLLWFSVLSSWESLCNNYRNNVRCLAARIACSHFALPRSLHAAQEVVAHVSHVRSKVADFSTHCEPFVMKWSGMWGIDNVDQWYI